MKWVLTLAVLLVVAGGGLGYYSFSLGQQVDLLNRELDAVRSGQETQLQELNENLASFRNETIAGLGNLEEGMERNLSRIDTLSQQQAGNQATITALQEGLSRTTSEVENLAAQVGPASRLTEAVMETAQIYRDAGGAVARISDGSRTVGTGFLYDRQAHVVTAHHVVADLNRIFAVFPDGRSFQASLAGSSEFSDVAVLKLEGEPGIQPLTLADSAAVQIGQPVAAIGSPFNLADTLTRGIVSQVDRFVDIEYDSQVHWIANLLQFDAAVNFGNSGCPLIDADGRVVGMVIARVPPDEGDGIHYAVSSNKVKRVADAIMAEGRFDYPWLGVDISDLTPLAARAVGLESVHGVLVNAVRTGAPAHRAGIRRDDVVIAFDGVPVKNVAALTSYLGEHKSPNDTATLTLIRAGEELRVTLEVGART